MKVIWDLYAERNAVALGDSVYRFAFRLVDAYANGRPIALGRAVERRNLKHHPPLLSLSWRPWMYRVIVAEPANMDTVEVLDIGPRPEAKGSIYDHRRLEDARRRFHERWSRDDFA